jgi:hypothetical protein
MFTDDLASVVCGAADAESARLSPEDLRQPLQSHPGCVVSNWPRSERSLPHAEAVA